MQKIKTALVTWWAWFIGSHLVDKLLEKWFFVICFDNLSSWSLDNLGDHRNLVKLCSAEYDIENYNFWEIFEKNNIDVIFHLAAQVSVRKSFSSPGENARVNIMGTQKISSIWKKYDVPIIFSSTWWAMFSVGDIPYNEDTIPSPSSPYWISKLYGEHILSWNKGCILRYANVFWPRQDPLGESGIIAILENRIRKGEETTIFGDGEQTRDFICVSDVVSANILAFEKGLTWVFHVGSWVETSINTLIKKLEKKIGMVAKIVYWEAVDEPRRSALDNSKIKKHWWQCAHDI